MSQADRIVQAVIMALYAGGITVLIQHLMFGMYSRRRK
jgi:hypothetical protein